MMLTFRPRASRRVPKKAAVNPLPTEETTPPVTKIYFCTQRLEVRPFFGFAFDPTIKTSRSGLSAQSCSHPRGCQHPMTHARLARRECARPSKARATARALPLLQAPPDRTHKTGAEMTYGTHITRCALKIPLLSAARQPANKEWQTD